MANRSGRVGAKVRHGRFVSRIVTKLPNLAHGAVMVEPPIDGCRYWNMDQLKYVKAKP